MSARPPGGGARAVLHRDLVSAKRSWIVPLSGFVEPVFYLLSIGFGVGALVGQVPGPGGHPVPYRDFVAPALLAGSAMNGGVFESFNVFFKMKYGKVYDTMLATPVRPIDIAIGEIAYAQLRGGTYAVGFLGVMLGLGLVHSPWAVLAVPVALFVGFAFGAVGTATATAFRSWQDGEWLALAVVPMFLLSATFFPLSAYPGWARPLVMLSPLFHATALLRGLTLGVVTPTALGHLAYLAVMGGVGLALTQRRIARMLLR